MEGAADSSADKDSGGSRRFKPKPIRSGMLQVIGALQNYGNWKEQIPQKLKGLEGKKKEILAANKQIKKGDTEAAGKRRGLKDAMRDNLLKIDSGLMDTFGQLLSAHTLVQQYERMNITYLDQPAQELFSCIAQKGSDRSKQKEAVMELQIDAMGDTVPVKEFRRIKLPGHAIMDGLAEGKPVNQINALLNCVGEIIMVNDCNQGADLEQFFMLPNMLQEFFADLKGYHDKDKNIKIVGFKENIFTEDQGIVGKSGALNEYVFGTIVQRQLFYTLNARLHYGHPDCFLHSFVLTSGGLSKGSKTVHVSEDIFGGMNVFMRGGQIGYADYMQIDKGRDVQYDAALAFEGKIAGGTAVQSLSRDFNRLMNLPLCFFHKVSLFSGSVGFFFSDFTLVWSIYLLTFLHGVLAVTPEDFQKMVLADMPIIGLLHLGYVYVAALFVQIMGERGISGAWMAAQTAIASVPIALCKMKTHHFFFRRGLTSGLAKYVATGRDLATKHVAFSTTFQSYSSSHMAPALDVFFILILVYRYSVLVEAKQYFDSTIALYMVAGAYIIGPAVYNPFSFNIQIITKDWQDWVDWVRSPAWEKWYYGEENGKGDFSYHSWYTWMNQESRIWMTVLSVAKSTMWGCMLYALLQKVSVISFNMWFIALAGYLIMMASVLKASKAALTTIVTYIGIAFVVSILISETRGHFMMAIYPLFRFLAAVHEGLVLLWCCRPWRAAGLPRIAEEKQKKHDCEKKMLMDFESADWEMDGAGHLESQRQSNNEWKKMVKRVLGDDEAKALENDPDLMGQIKQWKKAAEDATRSTMDRPEKPPVPTKVTELNRRMAAKVFAPTSHPVPSTQQLILFPKKCFLINNRYVNYYGQIAAWMQGTLYFGFVFMLATLCFIPLSMYCICLMGYGIYGLFGISNAYDRNVVALGMVYYMIFILGPLWVVFMLLGGQEPRSRQKGDYQKWKLLAQTLNFGSLHHWFVMNREVSRGLAEKAAR